MRTIKYVTWFNAYSLQIGIIILENANKELKSYVGLAAGFDKLQDIQSIADNGAKFPIEAAQELMKNQGEKLNIQI